MKLYESIPPVPLEDSPEEFIAKCLDKFGPIFTVQMLGYWNLTFLIGPEISAPFFKSDDSIMSQSKM